MRKANVTPSGIPASTKPMKSGTAEQEQNGVTMPNDAAATVPVRRPRPARAARTRSGGKKPRISVTTVMMPRSSSSDLGHVEQEEGDGLAKVGSALEPKRREGQPVCQRRLGEPGHEPGADRAPEHQPERHPSPPQDEGRHPSSPPSKCGRRLTGRLVAFVVDPAGIDAMPARPDQPSRAEPREVVRYVVLLLPERGCHLADAVGAVGEQAKDRRPASDHRSGPPWRRRRPPRASGDRGGAQAGRAVRGRPVVISRRTVSFQAEMSQGRLARVRGAEGPSLAATRLTSC